ncbi:hypothetical protein VTJ49DRAFT_3100 [Mycothermus thermophilus]|uniref:Uncharacterized protein n=1 Tax=Humicola insolens TaxID=85995 RepID=A0ABR3V919_HUMIN
MTSSQPAPDITPPPLIPSEDPLYTIIYPPGPGPAPLKPALSATSAKYTNWLLRVPGVGLLAESMTETLNSTTTPPTTSTTLETGCFVVLMVVIIAAVVATFFLVSTAVFAAAYPPKVVERMSPREVARVIFRLVGAQVVAVVMGGWGWYRWSV